MAQPPEITTRCLRCNARAALGIHETCTAAGRLHQWVTETAGRIRAISLWQPYASLVADGIKTIETRLRSTNVRGSILICATKRVAPPAAQEDVARRLRDRGIDPARYDVARLPRGVMLATANLRTCTPMTVVDEPDAVVGWLAEDGVQRFAWRLTDVVRVQPVAFTGGQGWRWCPGGLVRAA